jgi:hypothetical protein
MSRILAIKGSGLEMFQGNFRRKNRNFVPSGRVLSMKKNNCRGNSSSIGRNKINIGKADLNKVAWAFGLCVVLLGVFYLYQVNDLATKGYEIKDIEKQITSLSEVNKNKRIREVELRSMYNIEKATESLNLVSAKDVTYIDLGGPVAMK